MLRSMSMRMTILTLATALALPIGFLLPAVTHADAVVRELRFRLSGAQTLLPSPARMSGTVRAVDLVFEAKGSVAETVRLTVRAPGGLVVMAQDVEIAAETWQPRIVTVAGERVCASVTTGMRESWTGLRSDADRLARARAGHQEYLLQVRSRTVTLWSQQSLMARLEWDTATEADLAELDRQLTTVDALIEQARALAPSDVETLKSLAATIVTHAGEALPVATRLADPGTCDASTPLAPSGPGTYDVSLSQGGFPALSGEFRIDPATRVYLPALSRR